MGNSTIEIVPLCVDLDGTLIKSDLLLESALALLRKNPLYAFLMPVWLWRGKANLKRRIAVRTTVDPALLPYREDFLSWTREQAKVRRVILCTAADAIYADSVARHLACFSGVMASDGATNLSGARKARRLVAEFGKRRFDYAGNERSDLKVWRESRRIILAGASARLARYASANFDVERVFSGRERSVEAWAQSLRLHQWLKNGLVFLPMLAAHRLFDVGALWHSIAAWFLFGLCASGVYVLNDLLDLPADRRHPRKRSRPFAAGRLSLATGLLTNIGLTIAAFVGAVALSWQFAMALLGYWVLTNAYSLWLKRIVALDVIVLAGLYTIRILAGAGATHIPPSFWLLAFSMFLFLSLATLKRYAELVAMESAGTLIAHGRGYHVTDLPLVASLGVASGYLSVLVLALYIQGEGSIAMYRRPEVLWLLCPLLLYWISRAWFVAHRAAMHDDPVVFALTDGVSQAVLALSAIVVIGAVL